MQGNDDTLFAEVRGYWYCLSCFYEPSQIAELIRDAERWRFVRNHCIEQSTLCVDGKFAWSTASRHIGVAANVEKAIDDRITKEAKK